MGTEEKGGKSINETGSKRALFLGSGLKFKKCHGK